MAIIEGIRRFKKLDVRPLIAQGEQPFTRVMDALSRLKTDEALELHAPFLPAPLVERLSSEGYSHRFEMTGPGHWSVCFWRPPS